MKSGKIVGGIILTASIVSVGSAMSGWHKKFREDKKEQVELQKQLRQTGISEAEYNKIDAQAQAKKYPFSANRVYKKALDSLELKARYERVYLHALDSLKSDSVKILTKTAK
ncbi:MAG: hypothetical protein K2F57_06235 [Candidatus Gastranaerophilales bacterium]|nr:hypothetical protein [Candidatus Gastranaerophilales bacterium]